MAIDAEAKKILVEGAWASGADADRIEPEDDTPPLVRKNGYPISFSQADGDVITRGGANQRWYEIDSSIIAALIYGAQPFDPTVPWKKGSMIQYKGKLYCAESDMTAENPKTPGTDSEWGTLAGATSIPEAPSGLSFVRPEPNQLTLRWTPPKDGGEVITGYIVDRAGTTTNVTYPEITVTGLTNGTSYSFKVRAVNSKGNGPWSGVVTGTPVADKPGGGTEFSLQAVAGDGKVTLTWLEPNLGGATLQNYIVQWKSGTQNWSSGRSGTIAPTFSTYDVSGLTNGTEYDFQVRARSTVGDGSPSRTVSATPKAPLVTIGVPGAPPEPKKTPMDGGFIVNIMPPKDNGAQITRYQIRHRKEGQNTLTESPESSSSEIEVTGLTNGVRYGVAVRAKNSEGWGPWSGGGSWVTPSVAAPGAPIVGTLLTNYTPFSDGSMIVTGGLFPSKTGGSPEKYEIQQMHTTKSTAPVGAEWNVTIGEEELTYPISYYVPRGGKYFHARFRYKNSAGVSGWTVASTTYKTRGGTSGVPTSPTNDGIFSTAHLTRTFTGSGGVFMNDQYASGVTGTLVTGIRFESGGDPSSVEVRWAVTYSGTTYTHNFNVKKQSNAKKTYTAFASEYPKSSSALHVKIQARAINASGTGNWADLYDSGNGKWSGFAGIYVGH